MKIMILGLLCMLLTCLGYAQNEFKRKADSIYNVGKAAYNAGNYTDALKNLYLSKFLYQFYAQPKVAAASFNLLQRSITFSENEIRKSFRISRGGTVTACDTCATPR